MADYILRMQNSYKTLRWIEQELFPKDPDYIIAVRQRSGMLTFANDRAHIPGDWSNETIYKYPNIAQGEFILLDVEWGVVNYIKLRLGAEDNDVFVRVTDGPRTLIFANHHSRFAGWSGPTAFENSHMPPYPPLGSGQVVPGGNWIPNDMLYSRILEDMLGVTATPEMLPAILERLSHAEDIDEILHDTGSFVDEIAESHGLVVDVTIRNNIADSLNNNVDLFRNFNNTINR